MADSSRRGTRLRCADRSRSTAHASTATSASSPMAWTRSATSTAIPSTRQTCAGLTTAWVSVPMDLDAILSTPLRRCRRVPSVCLRRRWRGRSSSCRCTAGPTARTTTTPGTSPSSSKLTWPARWDSSTSISTCPRPPAADPDSSTHPETPLGPAPSAPTSTQTLCHPPPRLLLTTLAHFAFPSSTDSPEKTTLTIPAATTF